MWGAGSLEAVRELVCEVHMLGPARGHHIPQGFNREWLCHRHILQNLFPKALGPSVSPGSWPVFIWSNESLRPPACLPVMEQEGEEGLQEVPDVTGLRVSALLLPAMAEP